MVTVCQVHHSLGMAWSLCWVQTWCLAMDWLHQPPRSAAVMKAQRDCTSESHPPSVHPARLLF